MKRYLTAFLPLLTLVLLGAGCSTVIDDSLLGDCALETEWGSCIDENGIDDSLLGTWHLTDQTLSSGAGTVQNPFSGRSLTFAIDSLENDDPADPDVVTYGSYSENWASETGGDKTVTAPTGTYTSECEVSGTADGTWDAWTGLDLDNPDSDGLYPTINTLTIQGAGGGPHVECDAGGSTVTSTAASTPLATGPSTSTNPGGGVEYSYSVAGNTLVLINNNPYTGVVNTLTFSR